MAGAVDVQEILREMAEQEALFPDWRSTDYETVSKSQLFIDKTLLIKEVINHPSKYLLITAPQGFGKTTNLDMIRKFVEISINKKTGKISFERNSQNYPLFKKNRLISADKKFIEDNFAKFAVIHISFKDIYNNSMELLVAKYAEVLSKVFTSHKYLLKSDKISTEDKETISKYIDPTSIKKLPNHDLETGIAFLTKMVSLHCPNNKIFTFIDDYDSPLLELMTDYTSSNESESECVIFFRNIFANIVPPNEDIHRVLITGASTIGTTLFPPDCPVEVCNFLSDHSFADFYGITSNEADMMLNKFNKEAAYKTSLILIHGYITLGTKIIFGTTLFIHALITDRIAFYPVPLANVNLDTAAVFDIIRYILDKSLRESWFAFKFMPYTQHSINDIRRICINDYSINDSYQSARYHSYVHLLRDLGFFRLKKGTTADISLLKAANHQVKEMFQSVIFALYVDLDEDFRSAAEHFDLLCVSPNKEFFMEFADKLEKIYTCLFHDNPVEQISYNIYVPFINILARSLFELLPIHFASNVGAFVTDGLHASYDISGINIGIKFKSNAKAALSEVLSRTTHANWARREQYFFLGINFDESFSASFGLTINTRNIESALYFRY